MSHHDSTTINHDVSEPQAKAIFLAVFVTAIVLLSIVWCSKLFYEGTRTEDQNDKEGSMVRGSDLQIQRDMEVQTLTTAKILDQKEGRVQIPISDAIDRVVKAYQ